MLQVYLFLNKVNSSHVFIAAKQYQDFPTGGLVVPTEISILTEAEFHNNIEKIETSNTYTDKAKRKIRM